jgi:hypothetical protein
MQCQLHLCESGFNSGRSRASAAASGWLITPFESGGGERMGSRTRPGPQHSHMRRLASSPPLALCCTRGTSSALAWGCCQERTGCPGVRRPRLILSGDRGRFSVSVFFFLFTAASGTKIINSEELRQRTHEYLVCSPVALKLSMSRRIGQVNVYTYLGLFCVARGAHSNQSTRHKNTCACVGRRLCFAHQPCLHQLRSAMRDKQGCEGGGMKNVQVPRAQHSLVVLNVSTSTQTVLMGHRAARGLPLHSSVSMQTWLRAKRRSTQRATSVLG